MAIAEHSWHWLSYIIRSDFAKPGLALSHTSSAYTTGEVRTHAEAAADSYDDYRGFIQSFDLALFNLKVRTMRPVKIDTRLGGDERIALL